MPLLFRRYCVMPCTASSCSTFAGSAAGAGAADAAGNAGRNERARAAAAARAIERRRSIGGLLGRVSSSSYGGRRPKLPSEGDHGDGGGQQRDPCRDEERDAHRVRVGALGGGQQRRR